VASSNWDSNFQFIRFRFYAERENAFEAFKKGLIDLYPVYTARLWIHETKGEKSKKEPFSKLVLAWYTQAQP